MEEEMIEQILKKLTKVEQFILKSWLYREDEEEEQDPTFMSDWTKWQIKLKSETESYTDLGHIMSISNTPVLDIRTYNMVAVYLPNLIKALQAFEKNEISILVNDSETPLIITDDKIYITLAPRCDPEDG